MPFKNLGATRRRTYGTQDYGIYGFRGGLNVKDVPQDVRDDQLTKSINGILQVAGGWRMRNGFTARGTPPTGATGPILSGTRFWQSVKGGSAITTTRKFLTQVGNTLYDYDNNVNIGTIGSLGTPLSALYVRAQDPNDPNTGFTGGISDVVVICTGSGGPYVYDGTNLYTPAGWANAAGATCCAMLNGIVFFGGIPNNPRIIYGTGDGVIASFESLPGYNVFEFSYPVVGLAPLSSGGVNMLFIGMSIGAGVIYGTGPSNFVEQEIPWQADGLVSPRALASYGGTLFLQGKEAAYVFDGANMQPFSTNVEPWILNDPTVPGYPMTQNRGATFYFIYNNRLHIGYCSNSTTPNVLLSYNIPLNAWDGVHVTTPGMTCAIPFDAPGDTAPTQYVVGSSSTAQAYNWDVAPPSGQPATDAGSAINASMQTKFFKFGVPGTLKSLLRIYPEMYTSGPLIGNVTVTTDYGAVEQNYDVPLVQLPESTLWGSFMWGEAQWSGGVDFVPLVAPASRVDVDETQFESCALGIATTGGCAPWIVGGFTGTFRQLGRA